MTETVADVKADLRLGAFLPYRLASCGAKVSQAFARDYGARFGVTLAEWRVLAILGETAPLSSRDLVAETFMDKAKVSRAVAAMVERGLILREDHATDSRLLQLSLTEAGKRLHADIAHYALEWEAELVTVLPDGAAEMIAMLKRLEARLDELGAG